MKKVQPKLLYPSGLIVLHCYSCDEEHYKTVIYLLIQNVTSNQ